MSEKWKRYGAWKKKVYSMNRYSDEEMVHALKAWLIDQDIWFGDSKISITGTSQQGWAKEFRIQFKIEGLKGEFEVITDELTELDPDR